MTAAMFLHLYTLLGKNRTILILIYFSFRVIKCDQFEDNERKGIVMGADAECRSIGNDILNVKGGSAVDAAIATMLCHGVKMPHAMGIGGGFHMVVYDRKSRKAEHIDARDMSPAAADINIFNNEKFVNHTLHDYQTKWGLLSIAVPGELSGYWTAHQRHGKLPWADLFQPTIKLARYGFPMTMYTASALNSWSATRRDPVDDESLCEIFCNPDGTRKQEGDLFKMPKLADTLEIISKQGPKAFYDGCLTDKIIEELNSLSKDVTATNVSDKYFTREDFRNHQVKVREPFTTRLKNLTMFAPTSPASGPVVGFMLKLMEGFDIQVPPGGKMDNISEAKVYHKMAEAMKFGVAHRLQLGDIPDLSILDKMKDEKYIDEIRKKIVETSHDNKYSYAEKFAKEDGGTLHFSIFAGNGDAVSVTSSINAPLGSYHRSRSTGVIFNNMITDFTYDIPLTRQLLKHKFHEANLIGPRKKPISSQSPTILVDDKGEVRYVVGGAGGFHIISALLQVITRILWLGQDIKTAIDMPRMTNTLVFYRLRYEKEFDVKTLRLLNLMRHKTRLFDSLPCIARVECIMQHNNGTIEGYSDQRKFVT
ncbi:unnamed protein product [Owenia fusiformis]|uniref:Uncharacterized protein n=1 Tax=Owenia fusiformis TaxID=6347 RepID=A0A8J1Y0F6_OWEFU|nr:unnamed protein product [Owenia fusiformis]